MTAGDFVDMLATYSGVITASREDRAAALATAQAMLDERFPGASEIDVPMRAWCWRADRTPAPLASPALPDSRDPRIHALPPLVTSEHGVGSSDVGRGDH